jgi:hypothetical protein
MTKIFLYTSLTMGLSALAVGWITAGNWPVGLALLILIPISLFLSSRKFRATLSVVLSLTVLAAAAGLWAHVGLWLAWTAVVCILFAWDLDGFSRRLACASAEDNPLLIERRHLLQLSLALLLGMGIIFFAHSIRYVFAFEWAVGLAILAFVGIGALLNGMRNAQGDSD